MKKYFRLLLVILLTLIICPIMTGCFGNKNNEETEDLVIEIYFEQSDYYVEIGETLQLEALFKNKNVSNKTIVWESIDEGVAKIDENGLVAALSYGYTMITATTATGHSAYVYIYCIISPTSINLDKTEVEVLEGENFTLEMTLEPSNTTERDNVFWESSDSYIAEVNSYGSVYVKNAGTTTISAKTNNGLVATCKVTVKPYIKVLSVVLTKTSNSVVIPYDEDFYEFDLFATVFPKDASYPEVVWSSSDESIAIVENGHVTVLKDGNARIYAKTKDNVEKSCYIIAKKEIVATSISIPSSLSLIEGHDSKNINATWYPSNTTYKTLTWSSSNESVATVESGRITPLSVGTAVITAKTKNGKTATCIVTVNPKVYATGVSLNKTDISVEETYTETLSATVVPENTTDKTITWSSLDETIATVSDKGVVTGIKVGTTKIIASTNNGKTAECQVTVTELRIFVSAYVNGELYETLETAQSKNYNIELPEKPEDITTNNSNTNYFYGWFMDEECLQPVTTSTIFETNSSIYARNIEISTAGFSIDTSDASSVKISGFSNPQSADIVVVPLKVSGYTIRGIKRYAFHNISGLTTLIFLDHVNFEDKAISTTSSLRKILFNKACSNLTNATIFNCPNVEYNVYGGGYYLGAEENPYLMAVKADEDATEIVIHKHCFTIGNAFNDLENLQSIVVEDENLYYSSLDGVLYNNDKSTILIVPKRISGNISLPSSITQVLQSTFKDRTLITSVNLGENVARIDDSAFYGCTSLAQVTGIDQLKMIGPNAFYGCTSLATFNFENIISIDNNAFWGCPFLSVELPNTMSTIGYGSFGGNKNLTAISIPYIGNSSSTTISSNTKYPLGYIFGSNSYTSSIKTEQTYYYNGKLQTSSYYLPYELKTITIKGGNVYYGSFSNIINNVEIVLSEGIDTIEENAFVGCDLNKLTIPTTIKTIGNNAFKVNNIVNLFYDGDIKDWCEIEFLSVNSNPVSIATNVNFKNIKLTDIEIPAEITEIKNYAFYKFTMTTSVQLHENITSIGDCAFTGTLIQSVNFSENLENIGSFAFKECVNLKNIEIPTSIKILKNSVFEGCIGLKSAILPNTITEISSLTFADCCSLESIEIPSSVMYVGSKAFYNCSSLKTFNVSNKDITLSGGVIGGCSSLESITLSNLGENTDTYYPDNVLAYYFSGDSFEGGYEVKQSYTINTVTSYLPISLKSITILSGQLYSEAFANCTYVTDITLGVDVVRITDKNFYNCVNLKNLNILSKSLADMANYNLAFVNAGTNTSGLSINFGKELSNVPAYFLSSTNNGTTNITQINFAEDGVCSTIGSYAFAYAKNIPTISIPSSVETIANRAFYHCKVESILVAEDNENYSSVNGHLFTKDKNTLIQYAIGKTNKTYEITSNITSIHPYAFAGTENIEEIFYNTSGISDLATNNFVFMEVGDEDGFKVMFGENVTFIPDNLLYPSSRVSQNLVEIVFVENCPCTHIGKNAFAYSANLIRVNFPKNLKTVEAGAFDECNNITSVNYIGSADTCAQISYENEYANPMHYTTNFTINGEKVTELVISSNVKKVGNFAFYNFVDIEMIKLSDSYTSIGTKAFYNCKNLIELYIPYSSVTAGMLYGCSKLTTLHIPYVGDGTTTANEKALFGYIFGTEEFENAKATFQSYDNSSILGEKLYYIPKDIKTVKISSGVIPNGAFYGCSNIKTIELADTITTIKDCSFFGCSSLSSINIENITSIGKQAFYACRSLTKITLNDSFETIGALAFGSCANLREVDLGSSLQIVSDGLFDECGNLRTVKLNDNITTIGEKAFADCMGLKNVVLPKMLETIGSRAFSNCHGLYTINIEGKVKEIGTLAFEGCFKLIEVYNMSNLELKIGFGSNGGVAGHAKVVHTSADEESVLINIDNYIFADIDSKMYLISYEKDEVNATLPITEFDYTISSYAFLNLDNLKNVTIPNCVNGVETRAFTKCFNLDYLSLTSKISLFPEDLLYDCNDLSVFNYNGTQEDWFNINFGGENYNPMHFAKTFNLNGQVVTEFTIPDSAVEVGAYAFYNFKELLNITIPKNVTKLGDGAFKNCTSLQEINISKEVRLVGNQTFRNCISLGKIELPSAVTSIGEYAFYDCIALEEFVIPTSISEIGLYTFGNCSNLENILINDNINKIDEGAFYGCSNIEVFDIPDSVTFIGRMVFANCSSITTISLPKLSTEEEGEDGLFCLLFNWTNLNPELYVSVTQYDSSRAFHSGAIPKSLNSVTVRRGTIVCGAFEDCTSINNLSLIDVEYVDYKAFTKTAPYVNLIDNIYYVSGWVIDSVYNIEYANLKEGTIGISTKAFMDKNVKEFNGSESLKHIGKYAFKNCLNLTSVNVGKSLLTVGDEVFYGCSKITELNIPNTLTSFGKQVLYGCTLLESINIEAGCDNYVTDDGVLYNSNKTTIIKYPSAKKDSVFEFPETVTSIEDYAFMNTKVFSARFNNNLLVIGEGAFYESSVSRVEMRDRLKTIGKYAFYNCIHLNAVFIGENVKEIGSYAFAGCENLTENGNVGVVFPDICAWDVYAEDGKSVELTLSWNYEITTNNIVNVYYKNKWVRKY